MNFLEPTPTAWDLRWTMFGVPVRVHPMFWLVAALLGNMSLSNGLIFLFIWIGCVFVSVLVHELGHVVMGSAFGSHGHIVLYSFGGLAIGSNNLRERWQRIAVLFAGPAAGFLFVAAILAVIFIVDSEVGPAYLEVAKGYLGLPADRNLIAQVRYEPLMIDGPRIQIPATRPLFAVLSNLIYINILWGLVNLLPIWPLDGGQICREVCHASSYRHGVRTSLIISIAAAVGMAVWSLGSAPYNVLLFALLAIQSFQLLQQSNARWREDDWRRP